MPELLTVQEVAKRLKVSDQTIYNWLYNGILEGTKIGDIWRIPEENLTKAINNGKSVKAE